MRAGNSRVTNKKGILLVWITTFVLLPVKNSLWIKSLMDVRCNKLTVSHNLPSVKQDLISSVKQQQSWFQEDSELCPVTGSRLKLMLWGKLDSPFLLRES